MEDSTRAHWTMSRPPCCRGQGRLYYFDSVSTRCVSSPCFTSRKAILVADYSLLSIFILTLTVSSIVDRVFVTVLFVLEDHYLIASFFLALIVLAALLPVALQLTQQRPDHHTSLTWRLIHFGVTFVLSLLGLDSIPFFKVVFTSHASVQLLGEGDSSGASCPFVLAESRALSTLKAFSLTITVCKAVPSVILFALYGDQWQSPVTNQLASWVLLLNVVVISLSLTAALPVSKVPLVLTSPASIMAVSVSRFLAVLCFSGSKLIVVSVLYNAVGPGFFLLVLLCILCLGHLMVFLPHCRCISLRDEVVQMGLSLVYFIAYIHPQNNFGELAYWPFYFFKFTTELAVMYMTCASDQYVSVVCYVVMYGVALGFFSCSYGLQVILTGQSQINS